MRPRRDRWLSFSEIAELMVKHRPSLASLNKSSRRRYVRRVVQRAERRDEVRYTKRVGRALYVSRDALEHLLPYNEEAISNLERNMADVHQKQDLQERQLNGHGAKLRDHSRRLGFLEEREQAATAFLTRLAEIQRAENGTQSGHSAHPIRKPSRTGAS